MTLEEIIESYENGNFSQVKTSMIRGEYSFFDVYDCYSEYHNKDELLLFVKRISD